MNNIGHWYTLLRNQEKKSAKNICEVVSRKLWECSYDTTDNGTIFPYVKLFSGDMYMTCDFFKWVIHEKK
jgi:hypothetical protein